MNEVIEYLSHWKAELENEKDFDSIEEKAANLGLIGSIEVAISQLEICRDYGVNPGSWICVFPERIEGLTEPRFRAVCDNETHDSTQWSEVKFDNHGSVIFDSGDLVIKR